jgi:regulator of protease activity HflC (stomatin/prohibitin superfamily)
LKQQNSPKIYLTIGNIAKSIIRDKIANMTIDDVLKNRAALRDAIKKDIQTLLTGWGMWLETIEVSDVQICSGTLFSNMQAEFKEENRLKS